MVLLMLLLVVLLVGVGGVTTLLVVLIRKAGAQQQAEVEAQVKAFIDDLHTLSPEAAAMQAQIDRNLGDADALEAQVEAQEAAPPPPATSSAPQQPLDPGI